METNEGHRGAFNDVRRNDLFILGEGVGRQPRRMGEPAGGATAQAARNRPGPAGAGGAPAPTARSGNFKEKEPYSFKKKLSFFITYRFYLVLLGFTVFYCVLLDFNWVLPSFVRLECVVIPSFTWSHWVLTGFYLFLCNDSV